jgi:hypothetical protein
VAKRKPYLGPLTPISKSKFSKALRNRRCVLIGGDEGGSTFQCGKQIYANDHVNNLYYKLTGKGALYTSYQLKQRNKGYREPLMKAWRGEPPWVIKTTKKRKRRR